jgi:MerR family transcriptional regulator, light-induced transcriptional regulator
MGAYTIRELENLSGIKAHTIRIWEKRYGLIAPQRTSTNIRTYCDTELKKLLNISILNRNGIKISRIAQLSTDEIVEKINQYSREASNTDSQIESLTIAMIDLDEFRFEQVLARSIIQLGFEETVTRVLYPFFVRIGLMWQTGSVNPAQEHFITNLIKQKFFVAIDGIIVRDIPGTRRFVFFLPEGELHEIGLLFFCYLAKKRGHRVLYLGQSVPFNDLVTIPSIRKIDYLVTSFTSSFNGNDLAAYVHQLANIFRDQHIIVSGSRISDLSVALPSNVIQVPSPLVFIDELDKIAS